MSYVMIQMPAIRTSYHMGKYLQQLSYYLAPVNARLNCEIFLEVVNRLIFVLSKQGQMMVKVGLFDGDRYCKVEL
jgi:hypothetical protein